MSLRSWLVVFCTSVSLCACSGDSTSEHAQHSAPDSGSDTSFPEDAADDVQDAASDASDAASDVEDAQSEADVALNCDDKAKNCATQFGSLFTKSNGRADGTLIALVRPSDTQCAMPNSTHAVLQLSIQGKVQRLVASVDGVALATKSAPLIGPAYAEGWHENVTLEYPTSLGVHSTDFTPVSLDGAVSFLCEHLSIGAPVSVFAYSDGTEPSSAHEIHSNDNYPDGAIVVDPTSATPTYLLFRYLDQVF